MHKLHPYHEMLFNAVIKERKEFPDLNSIADFFAQNGLNKEEFLKNANSFSTKVKNDRAFKTWHAKEVRLLFLFSAASLDDGIRRPR